MRRLWKHFATDASAFLDIERVVDYTFTSAHVPKCEHACGNHGNGPGGPRNRERTNRPHCAGKVGDHLSTALSILAALVLLSILVMVHELGHYTAGRLLGFTIWSFPSVWGRCCSKETKTGFNTPYARSRTAHVPLLRRRIRICRTAVRSTCKKCGNGIVVVLAGPVMNLLFAFIVAIITLPRLAITCRRL